MCWHLLAALRALHPPLTCCSRTPCYRSPQGDPRCLNVVEFDRLLRESQKEVLRLQRQIALKNFKDCLRSSKNGSGGSSPSAAVRPGPAPNVRGKDSPAAKEVSRGEPAAGWAARGTVRRAGQRATASPLRYSIRSHSRESDRGARAAVHVGRAGFQWRRTGRVSPSPARPPRPQPGPPAQAALRSGSALTLPHPSPIPALPCPAPPRPQRSGPAIPAAPPPPPASRAPAG